MIKPVSDVTISEYKLEAKIPEKKGTLVLEKKEGMLSATWRKKKYPVKKDVNSNCFRISLPSFSVRIFESEGGENFLVDIEDLGS